MLPGWGPSNEHLSNDGKASSVCQTHLTPPLEMMLFPLSRGEGDKLEVFRLSELTLPWKLWWRKFFFPHRTPSFLPSFPSYLLFLLPCLFLSFVCISIFFSSKKHLSHSHSYSFSRLLPASCKATDSEIQENWPHLPEMKKRNIRNLPLSNKIKTISFARCNFSQILPNQTPTERHVGFLIATLL